MPEDFSTIEHDFLQMKDYFSNYKFIYKERKSKLDFFQNINHEAFQDTSDILSSSKQQLVEVKQGYKDLDNDIKALSRQICQSENEIKEKKIQLDEATELEAELTEQYERLCQLGEKLKVNDSLNNEFDKVENDIREIYQKIDQIKESVATFDLKSKIEEEQDLKSCKQELAAKQKRLTIINTESYMEDIYSWYEGVNDFFKKVFGNISVSTNEDRLIIKLGYNDGAVEITLKNKRLVDVSFNCSVSESLMNQIEDCKAYCTKINDLKMLFALLLMYREN